MISPSRDWHRRRHFRVSPIINCPILGVSRELSHPWKTPSLLPKKYHDRWRLNCLLSSNRRHCSEPIRQRRICSLICLTIAKKTNSGSRWKIMIVSCYASAVVLMIVMPGFVCIWHLYLCNGSFAFYATALSSLRFVCMLKVVCILWFVTTLNVSTLRFVLCYVSYYMYTTVRLYDEHRITVWLDVKSICNILLYNRFHTTKRKLYFDTYCSSEDILLKLELLWLQSRRYYLKLGMLFKLCTG